eukprot:TRINITY_DN6535_c0_g1_i2.p1 TRINITY_DN6535_c0_g1~~TRINITY_DN6535_c0_g1_i2.p1  ORF type:complete len:293 (+),score=69.64 TRINITY_DN6535_c0_g1_i2:134-1012(+)
MCIRDRYQRRVRGLIHADMQSAQSTTPFPGEHVPSEEQSLSSSDVTAPMSQEEPKSCKQKVMKNVRWITALTGIGLVVAAIFSFLSCILSFSFSGIILCVYLCPIGIAITITETEKFFYQRVVGFFPILRTHVGRGFSYIFIAGLTISVGTISCWIVGLTLLAEGIVSIMFHYNKEGDRKDDQLETLEQGAVRPSGTATPAYTSQSDFSNTSGTQMKSISAAEPGSRSLAEVDRGSDFGSGDATSGFGATAASAAFDYAARNPEQAMAVGQASYKFAQENPEAARTAKSALL